MKRKIKVKCLGDLKDGYIPLFLKLIKKKISTEKKEKDFDLLIYDYIDAKSFNTFFKYKGKKLFISGENCSYFIDYQRNLLFIKNLLKLSNYLYIHYTSKLFSIKKKIIFLIENSIPTFLKNKRKNILFYFAHNYNVENEYAILSNKCKSNNVLNLPLFFAYVYSKKKEFIDIKIKKKYEKKKHFCAFFVSNQQSKGRIMFFEELSKYKKVNSYGGVLNNKRPPKKLVEGSQHFFNYELYRDYKFVICFENSIADDYITEKLPNAMLGNSIGIYQGAPNIGDFFNTKSFINFHDYGSYAKMIEKIIELDQDDKKYYKMLREPFFAGNKIPPRFNYLEKDLANFLARVLS